ncbi:hypothetical protein [Streptomyces sp. C10-9-1]|uniref:hypothetical protein n=1 Tax=Streptomyces sp. C10-9-1 TaxID=1859285 RepID=UPI003F49B8B9
MTSDSYETRAEVAGTFAVHVLPVGPVIGFQDADTVSEAALTAEVLRRLGGEAVAPPLAGGMVQSLTDADEALARWAGEHDDGNSRCPSALLWFGHGRVSRMGSVLLVPGSKKRGNTRVTPEMLAHYVHADQLRRNHDETHWSLVVLEACNSENFASDLAGLFNGTRQERTRSLLLIATGKPSAQGYLGTFRTVLEKFLSTKKTSHDIFNLRELQGYFKSHQCYAELVGDETGVELALAVHDRVPLTGATTVAEVQRQQRRYDEAPGAWPRRSTPHKAAFLEMVPDFTGRTAPLRAIAEWCAGDAEAAVLAVTGAPGTGKSALLGEALLRWSQPARETPEGTSDPSDVGDPVEGADRPGAPTPPIVAVLPLTGSTAADVVRQLAEQLDAPPADTGQDEHDEDDATLDAVRRHLTQLTGRSSETDSALAEDGQAFNDAPATGTPMRALIVADALDEARDPFRIAGLLRELTTIPGVRLLIGTRPTRCPVVPSAQPSAGGSRDLDLLGVFGSASRHARVLALEPDPSAARAYAERKVRGILRNHFPGDTDRHETVTRTVASAVEGHVRDGSWQFLQASLVVQEIEQRPALLAPGPDERAALAAMLERDQSGLFRAAVQRITTGLPAAEPLLRALAWSHGRGLPLADGIWAHAAVGIAETDAPIDDEQLELFLNRAAAYILVDGEDRRSVYRLAHRTYAEQLVGDSPPEGRFDMFHALLELAASQVESGRPLSPHLATRLAEYAADCGAAGWEALAARPTVVDQLPPASLSSLALTPRQGAGIAPADLPVEVLGTVASAHLIKEADPGDRPGLRQLGGLRATGLPHPTGSSADWEVAWGRLHHVPLHLQLGGSPSAITAIAARADAPWLVTGSLDGSVMVWEPWRDHHPTALLSKSESPVTALAASGTPHKDSGEGGSGTGLVAVAHADRTVRLWDTDVDRHTLGYAVCTESVRVIVPLADGSRRFLLGGESGYLALLDPDGALSPAAEAVAPRDVVGMAQVPGPEDTALVVAAYQSGDLALWGIDGNVPTLLHRASARTALAGLVPAPTSAEPNRLLALAEDGHLGYWRVRAGGSAPRVLLDTAADLLQACSGADPILAVMPVADGDGVPLVGDRRGVIQLVRPAAAPGRPELLETSTGSRPIRAIGVLLGPQGDGVLVTVAERDSRVHFFDPAAATRASVAPVGPESWVDDMRRHVRAEGTETLVVAEQSAGRRTVRVLRATDGALMEVAPPSDKAADGAQDPSRPSWADGEHSGSIVDCVTLDEPGRGPEARIRVTAGREGTIVVWREEPSGRRPVRRIPLGSPCVRLTALASGRLAIATDDGVVVLRLDSLARAVHGEGTEETHG